MLKSLYGKVRHALDQPIRNKHVKTALPFFLFMAIGLVVIRECATVRLQFRKSRILTKEEAEAIGVKLRDVPETLEEVYEKYKKVDIDNWENIRGPRLFEETPSSEKS